ncbi:apolipo protein D [Rhypophila decipiens]|uniref:Apolipo protein D n=1 Tax=Rhypophila decipiens TaxID=261697 RepID=A0AAN7B2N5_9PEZI|nr:apolipo protein D [Rhypophila decipiens]
MHFSSAALAVFAATAAAQNASTPARNVVPATYDGKCFYPKPDIGFDLKSYVGRWYQVAGTPQPFNAACKCTYAQYSINDNGSVRVNNTCQAGNRAISILGTATPAPPQYGATGVFTVLFPGERPADCPGPNYIVQDYTGDFSLVQNNNLTTLFLLSREQHPKPEVLDAWIKRAGLLGSDISQVVKTDQTDCQFL